MDIFRSIDWNPSLNDIIDEEFVTGERLERESALYRILRGSFSDPFADLHEDFKDRVTKQDIDAFEQDRLKKLAEAKAAAAENPQESEKNALKFAKYYPGILKNTVTFPRSSSLTVQQQAACIRVLLQFSAPGKPDITKSTREDLATYSSLQTVIAEEQAEFLKVAKDHWNPEEIKLIREDLVNRKWKYKMKYVEQLPRFYSETGTIPFISDKDIKVKFDATCLEKGKIPRVIIPILNRPSYVFNNSVKMEATYFRFPEEFVDKNLVSEDSNCLDYAEDQNIDLVLSSSGLSCLANNLDPSYKNSWSIPLVVKEINGRSVGFIDKPLPPLAKTAIQKNSWMFKYILKSFFLHPTHSTSVNLDEEEECRGFVDLDAPEEDMEPEESADSTAKNGMNVSYNIFTIGSCGLAQNELMKNKVERDYRILVRTKTDGVEKLPNNQIQCMSVAPKLEHQLVIGAEAVTLEEASKQWASLTFRPDTSLLRVRINYKTSEMIQYERRTAISVNNEMKRLYNVKGEDSLQLMYNIAEAVSKMSPGRYLIRHTPRNGAFATVYAEADSAGAKTIDLQAVYGDEVFRTIPNPPWPLIDKMVPLPMHECFSRMPAMFYPSNRPRGGSQRGRGRMNMRSAVSPRQGPKPKNKGTKQKKQGGDAATGTG